jgi:hypothetical protein
VFELPNTRLTLTRLTWTLSVARNVTNKLELDPVVRVSPESGAAPAHTTEPGAGVEFVDGVKGPTSIAERVGGVWSANGGFRSRIQKAIQLKK